MNSNGLERWPELEFALKERFGKVPDLQTILFLIGVDVLAKPNRDFSKEEKQDLIHIGICYVLTYSAYYRLEGRDKEGWPHFIELLKVPTENLKQQERLLKAHIIHHFESTSFF